MRLSDLIKQLQSIQEIYGGDIKCTTMSASIPFSNLLEEPEHKELRGVEVYGNEETNEAKLISIE
jgi:hypothetical protein